MPEFPVPPPSFPPPWEGSGEAVPPPLELEEGIPLLAQLPIDPALAKECDTGVIELFNEDWMEPVIRAVEDCPERTVNP